MTKNPITWQVAGARRARTRRAWTRSLMALATLIRLRGPRADRPRRIDFIIDYFGERRPANQHG